MKKKKNDLVPTNVVEVIKYIVKNIDVYDSAKDIVPFYSNHNGCKKEALCINKNCIESIVFGHSEKWEGISADGEY